MIMMYLSEARCSSSSHDVFDRPIRFSHASSTRSRARASCASCTAAPRRGAYESSSSAAGSSSTSCSTCLRLFVQSVYTFKIHPHTQACMHAHMHACLVQKRTPYTAHDPQKNRRATALRAVAVLVVRKLLSHVQPDTYIRLGTPAQLCRHSTTHIHANTPTFQHIPTHRSWPSSLDCAISAPI